ncbi:MAG: putative RNA uridine N3 methyltransferase [Candidatus Thorarchaeota archaeon]
MGLSTIKLKQISAFLPSTALDDAPDLRAKTEKVFRIARSFAIFKIPHCIIYRDPFITKKQHQKKSSLLQLLLKYLECPQYLRKRLFPRHSLLAFAGVMPPLAAPHHFTHPPSRIGEIREAVVFLSQGQLLAEVGRKKPISVSNAPRMRLSEQGRRMTVRITNLDPLMCEIIEDPIQTRNQYWGYKVRVSDALLSHALSNYDGIILATSSKCSPLLPTDKTEIETSSNIAFLFGSPSKGLPQILKAEEKHMKDIADLCFNIFPNPGTRTIRLEEAIFLAFASLLN